MDRKRRGVPGKVPVLELQERDYDVLECLSRLGHVGADLLALHFWGDRDSDPARRRLRKLLDRKAISDTVVGSRRANLCSLTRTGLELLVGRRGEVFGARLYEPVRAAAGVQHAQLLVAFRLYLVGLEEAGHGCLLAWSGGRGERAAELGLTGARIAPDGIADLRIWQSMGVGVVEADTGTEGLELRRKLERYAAYFGRSVAPNVQVWIAAEGNEQRLATIARWVDAAGLSSRVRLFPAAMLWQRPAPGPVARLDRVRAAGGTVRTGSKP